MDIANEVTEMGRLARGLLLEASAAMQTNNRRVAHSVIARMPRLAALDEAIEAACMEAIVGTPTPEPARMRRLAAYLKIITSVNRIGRYAGDLAQATVHMAQPPPAPAQRLAQMAGDVDAMVATVLEGLHGEPIDGHSLLALEDEVDRADHEVREAVITALEAGAADPRGLVELALASRALERCADHACKMAEKLHAAVLGERILYR